MASIQSSFADNIICTTDLTLRDRALFCTLSEWGEGGIFISLNKIEIKFVAQLLNRILSKDILTFSGLDYRHALIITLYLVVIGTSIQL